VYSYISTLTNTFALQPIFNDVARAARTQSVKLWQQATIKITRPAPLHQSKVTVHHYYQWRLHTKNTLFSLVRAVFICVLFLAHIQFVLHRACDATPTESRHQ